MSEHIDQHAAAGGVPPGCIVMWSGLLADIPTGWALCDGLGGRPDLRSRFIKGAAAAADPGATGGAVTHAHAGHAAHAFTQPSGHAAHAFTQPSGHAAHAFTQPTAHTSAATPDLFTSNTGGTGVSPSAHAGGAVDAHSAHAGGAVDAHSAHAGGAVDAHSAHDAVNHEPAFFALAFIVKL